MSREPEGFAEDVLALTAAILRAAGDADLVFVGRSLESVHDFLDGAFALTTWRDRPRLLEISFRDRTVRRLRQQLPFALPALYVQLDGLGITPERILARPRPVAFVDLVSTGRTFANLDGAFRHWLRGDRRRLRALGERLRWVAVVERGKAKAKGVAIDDDLWCYLGNDQPKMTRSSPPDTWCDPREARLPDVAMLRAGERWRSRLAATLARPPMPEPWLDALIRELRVSA